MHRIIFLLCLFAHVSFSEVNDIDIVKRLFPQSVVDTFDNYFGFKNEKAVLTSFTVRDKSAFIPLSDIVLLKLNSNYNVISFPIYLANKNKNKKISTIVKDRVGDNDEERQKLIQLLFISDDGEVISKPKGFPLESSAWTCLGDICDNISIVSLDKISGYNNSCKFIYTKGIDQMFFKVFQLSKREILFTDEILQGDTIDENGDEINISYSNFKFESNFILVDKIIQNDYGQSKKNVMLKLNPYKF